MSSGPAEPAGRGSRGQTRLASSSAYRDRDPLDPRLRLRDLAPRTSNRSEANGTKREMRRIQLTHLVIVGAGGFGREVLDVLRDINSAVPTFDFLGFLSASGRPSSAPRPDWPILR